MPKATPIINNFNGGEVSPKIDARSDIQKYYSACRTLENFIPLVEGGATRAPGTYFVIATKDSGSKVSRLHKFQFSTVQAYILEIGEEYIRFYKDNGQIVVAYAAWANGTAYALGALVTSGGNYYRCIVAHTSIVGPGVFATDLAAGYWAATAGATDLAYEIPTPYAEADLAALKFFGSADILWITHPSYPTKQLARTAHTAWTLTNHLAKIGDEMTITGISQAATAVVTCTTVPATLAAGDIVYITGVVGMTEVNDRFFTVGTVVTGAGGTIELSGEDSQTYGAWASAGTVQETLFGTEDNCPACGTFFEQRMALAGTNTSPQLIALSASDDYSDFEIGSDDANAIQYTLVSDRVDRIRWMIGQDYIMIGTVGGIWRFGATSTSDPVTPSNVNAKKQVWLGSADIDCEVVSDALLYVTRSGLSVRQVDYSFEKDRFMPTDMTKIAKHIAKGATRALSGIVDMDFQSEPLPILWAVRADGVLLGMTYEHEEQVFAWFRIVTDGEFESVAVISEDNTEDQVWAIVKRTINGSTVRYVEYFKPQEFFSEIKDCFFVHSGLSWEGTAAVSVTSISLGAACSVVVAAGHGIVTGDKIKFRSTGTWLDTHVVTAHLVAANTITVWNEGDTAAIDSTAFTAYVSGGTIETVKKAFTTGLDHLEGEELDILVDGAVHPRETVAAGALTLDYYGNKIHLGLPYTSTLEPMKLHTTGQLGTIRGKKQKVTKLTACFYETRGGKAGPDTDNLKTIPFGTGAQPELFTGDIEFNIDGNWGNEATISIVQEQPLPMTVLAIVPHLNVEEG